MNVLVTGAAGYVGSVVAPALLAADHLVRACDIVAPLAGDPLVGDLCDASFQRDSVRGIDAVVHLAALVRVGRESAEELRLIRAINVEATRGLVAAAAAAGVRRFIVASTCGLYGVSDAPAAEDHPVTSTSPYAESKLEAERIVLSATTNDFAGTVLRFATIFGASRRVSFEPLANALVQDAVVNRRVVIFGASARRPFVHVQDAARAVALVLGRRPDEVAGQIYNVGGDGLVHTKAEIASLLQGMVPGLVVETKPEADVRDYAVDFGKIGRLGFATQHTLRDGLREVVDLVREGAQR